MKTLEPTHYAAEELPEHGPPEPTALSGDDLTSGRSPEAVEPWTRTSAQIERLLAAAEQVLTEAETAPLVAPFAWPELSTPPDGEAGQDVSLAVPRQVELRIEVVRATLTAAEVRQLRGGDTVALAAGDGARVAVYAGEQIVARGELMIFNEQFCVRITERLATGTTH